MEFKYLQLIFGQFVHIIKVMVKIMLLMIILTTEIIIVTEVVIINRFYFIELSNFKVDLIKSIIQVFKYFPVVHYL